MCICTVTVTVTVTASVDEIAPLDYLPFHHSVCCCSKHSASPLQVFIQLFLPGGFALSHLHPRLPKALVYVALPSPDSCSSSVVLVTTVQKCNSCRPFPGSVLENLERKPQRIILSHACQMPSPMEDCTEIMDIPIYKVVPLLDMFDSAVPPGHEVFHCLLRMPLARHHPA